MINKFLLIMLYAVVSFCIYGTNIFVSSINIYNVNPDVNLTDNEKNASNVLFDALLKTDYDGMLILKKIPTTVTYQDRSIKSELEASEICDLLNIDYLLYGSIEKTNKFYNAEIFLYDNAAKSNKKTLYVKTELGDFDQFINEITLKFINYMYDKLGLTELKQERKLGFGGIGLVFASGYWIPMGNWWDFTTGLVCFETGMNVIPLKAFVKMRNFAFYMRFGLNINYSLGMNKPGHLTSYLNTLLIKVPIENCFELFNYNVITVGVGPQLQIDMMYQKLLYDPPQTKSTAAFSLYCSTGYEYWFTKKKLIGMGLINIFDFTFYDNFFVDYKVMFYTVVRIDISGKKVKADIDGE
jgi:hypothetical protein